MFINSLVDLRTWWLRKQFTTGVFLANTKWLTCGKCRHSLCSLFGPVRNIISSSVLVWMAWFFFNNSFGKTILSINPRKLFQNSELLSLSIKLNVIIIHIYLSLIELKVCTVRCRLREWDSKIITIFLGSKSRRKFQFNQPFEFSGQ